MGGKGKFCILLPIFPSFSLLFSRWGGGLQHIFAPPPWIRPCIVKIKLRYVEQIHQNRYFSVGETSGRATWTILTQSDRPPRPTSRRQTEQFVHKTALQILKKKNWIRLLIDEFERCKFFISWRYINHTIKTCDKLHKKCLKIRRYCTYKIFKLKWLRTFKSIFLIRLAWIITR